MMSVTMTNDEIAEQLLSATGNVLFDDWAIYDTGNYTIVTTVGELVANFSGNPKWRGDNLQYVVACSPNNIKSLLNERATLKAENTQLREALKDNMAGLNYVRTRYGELSGIGFDRAIIAGGKALEGEPK